MLASRHANAETASTQRDSKDVPQFAPNFTVYVLPPDVVCLYSEDRKFFLHGELYCALASAIGKAARAFAQLVRELEKDFPSDKIHEALKRLIDRRYVVPASRSSAGAAAAYWASLGLPPADAEQNLQNCRVRIQSIDVQGATELGAALKALGVRVVRGARRPDRHAGERLSRSAAGRIEPAAFVGPHALAARPALRHFSSGGAGVQSATRQSGACWTCLADRMKRNREVKAFLDRKQARRVAASPLARHTFGQSAIQLAAVEIAKAIATDFRTDLSDHIISLDLLGSTIAKHYVAARPQCPTCGHKKLRDPAPRAGAGRTRRRRQSGHDQRGVPDRFVAGHGRAFPQAREPAHRRGLAARADRSRFADEHQLLCHAQFLRPPARRSTSSGRD